MWQHVGVSRRSLQLTLAWLLLVACRPSGPSPDELSSTWDAELARHALGTWERPPIVSGARPGAWGPALAAVDPELKLSGLFAKAAGELTPLPEDQVRAAGTIGPLMLRGAASPKGRSPYALGSTDLVEDPVARRPFVATQLAYLLGRTRIMDALRSGVPNPGAIDLMAASLQLAQDQARGATLLVAMLSTANVKMIAADLRATLELPGWSKEGLARLSGHLTALVSAPPRFADVVESEGLAIQAAFVAAHRGSAWAPPAGANQGPAASLVPSDDAAAALAAVWALHSRHLSRLRGVAAGAPPGGLVDALRDIEVAADRAADRAGSPAAAFYQQLKLVGHAERWVCARQHLTVAAADAWLRAELLRTEELPHELPDELALDPASGGDFKWRIEAGIGTLQPSACPGGAGTAPELVLAAP